MKPKSVAVFGEILWDLLPTGPVLGGAPFNFAYRMHSLGVTSTLFSLVGTDVPGNDVLKEVRKKRMDQRCIGKSSDYPTGTVDIHLDHNKNPDFTIFPDVAFDYIEITPEMEEAVKQAHCFYFGTVAQRSRVSRECLTKLLKLFSGRHILFDINLRKGCYTMDIIRSSLSRCTILKINEEEIHMAADSLNISHGNLETFADQIMQKTKIEICVITLGKKGAFVMSNKGEKTSVPAFLIDPVDTCGSGDGFAAGFLYALLQEKKIEDACMFGNALGALVALQKGATGLIPLHEIEQFTKAGDLSK